MAYQMVSNQQLSASVASIIVAVAMTIWLMRIFFNYLDLPEVYMDIDGKCVKVVNFKNGDGYTCQDKDVILRKYVVIHVK